MPRGNREVAMKNLEKGWEAKKQQAKQRKIERAKELLAEEQAKNVKEMDDDEKMEHITKKQLARDMIDGRDGEKSEESSESEEEVEHDFVDIVARRVAGMKLKTKQKKTKKAVKKKVEEESESESEESEEEPQPKKGGKKTGRVNVNVYAGQPEKTKKESNDISKMFLKF